MGEATFILKALFKNKKEANAARIDFQKFLSEYNEVYEEPGNEIRRDAKPRVKEYLSILKITDPEPSLTYYGGDYSTPYCENNIMFYSAEVGHLSSWDDLTLFFSTKYKPIKAIWGSNEYIDPRDSLNLYPWEDIVNAILKHKTALPTLLGLHKDLDQLISQALRG